MANIGFDLWGITHVDARARSDADRQWESFASSTEPGHVTIGTIIKAAKDAGFGSASQPARFSGQGGDVTNGKLFANKFVGKFVYIRDTGEWLKLDDQNGWMVAPIDEVDRAAKEVLAEMSQEAAERWRIAPDDPAVKRLRAHVERTSRLPNLRAMIEMAKSEAGIAIWLRDFDADPMLLGVANGVLDLKSGRLRPMSPQVRVSKRCRVVFDSDAQCPRFMHFLAEIQPDEAVRAFLQRFIGYCLTGSVKEQVFLFLHGSGANGKSVFIELIAWLLGDYARKVSTDMLMQHNRSSQAPDPDIVSLKGMRYIYANETEEGRRLSDARIKDLTGGDTLTGRVPYAKSAVSFEPTFKLVIAGNHKPEITDMSEGMWRRTRLIRFDQTIPEGRRDTELLATLKSEGPGVLNWAMAGLLGWRAQGLSVPYSIEAATNAYRAEQDVLNDFIIERCEAGEGYVVEKDELYGSYVGWCSSNGHKPMSRTKLTRRLNDRKFKTTPDRRKVESLKLRSPFDDRLR